MDVDIVNVPESLGSHLHDLASEATWRHLRAELQKGRYDGVLFGPPCSAFSVVRRGPPGPRPLRSL
eukprot:3877143-Lingulodinium_polyedra.AAC.1